MRRLWSGMLLSVLGLVGCTSWHEKMPRVPVDPALAELRPPNNDVLVGRDLSKREDAFYVLLNAGMYCPGRYGYAAVVSPMLKAMKTVMREPDAANAFEDLCKRGSPAGRLYGASGLWLMDCECLKRVSKELENDSEEVLVAEGGCEIVRVKVGKAFKSRKAGTDVVGGGYPEIMRRLMH